MKCNSKKETKSRKIMINKRLQDYEKRRSECIVMHCLNNSKQVHINKQKKKNNRNDRARKKEKQNLKKA